MPSRPNPPQQVAVTVAVAQEALGAFGEVVQRCELAGLHVDQALVSIGVITGTIAADQIIALRDLSGVDSVEVARDYDLPPPDSPVQ